MRILYVFLAAPSLHAPTYSLILVTIYSMLASIGALV